MTLMTISIAMSCVIVLGGFIQFTFNALEDRTIHTQIGHLQIYKAGFNEQGALHPKDYLLNAVADIEQGLSEIDHISLITRRLNAQGLISTGDNTLTANIVGIMPEREEDLYDFEMVIEGEQVNEDHPQGGVIGLELAQQLRANVGDWLSLMSNSFDGSFNIVDFQVIGIVETGSQAYDKVFVKVPIALVQQLKETSSVERLILLLDKTENLSQTTQAIDAYIHQNKMDIEYKTWINLASYYKKVKALYSNIFHVFGIIISVIVLFSISNTLTTLILERTKEIGTLRALGLKKCNLFCLFMCEGLIIGCLGGGLGLLISMVGIELINFSGGISVPAPPGMSTGYNAYILWVPQVMIFSYVAVISISILATIYPTCTAVNMNVVRALKKSGD